MTLDRKDLTLLYVLVERELGIENKEEYGILDEVPLSRWGELLEKIETEGKMKQMNGE